MGKKITLTESQLIRVIERVIMEQEQAQDIENTETISMLLRADKTGSISRVVQGFKMAGDKLKYLQAEMNKIASKVAPNLINRFNNLINKLNTDKNFCSSVQKNIEDVNRQVNSNPQGEKGSTQSGAMFLIALAIIVLIAFVPVGGRGSCADQMGLTGRY